MREKRMWWPMVILLIIVAFAIFFRFWMLSDIPAGVYPDEAKNANDAVATLQSGEYRIFYPENNGREGLHIWLLALAFRYLGVSIFALKFVSAAVGTLTVVATYLLTREIFKFSTRMRGPNTRVRFSFFATEIAALLASGFLAVNFWHVNFSRIAFRAIFVPLLLALATYFTLRALRTRGLGAIIASGVLWGAGYYTYIAFRVALVIPLFLISTSFLAYLYYNRPHLSRQWLKQMFITDGWWKFTVWAGALAATLAPLVVYFLTTPSALVSRSGGISVFDAERPLFALLKSLGLHLQMFFVQGDGNLRHNVGADPQLLWPVGILFLLGLAYSAWISWEGVRYRNWYLPIGQLMLLGWFVALLAPAFLTIEGVPHALRAIGVLPVVFIYAAFGFLLIVRVLFPHRHHRSAIWPFGLVVALVLLLLVASFQFNRYFFTWGSDPEVAGAFTNYSTNIGRYLNEEVSSAQRYVIINEGGAAVSYPSSVLSENNTTGLLPMPAQTPLFIQYTHSLDIKRTTYLTIDQLPLAVVGPAIFIPIHPGDDIQRLLREHYPLGEGEQLERAWVYKVP